jgi:hypothetical protein
MVKGFIKKARVRALPQATKSLGRRVRVVWRGECGFSSLLKQKIKTKNKKNLPRHLQRRNFFLNFLCYEVFAKQKRKLCAANYYSRDLPVLVHCAHAHANLGGFHLSWNERLYRSACRRPQLNPRGPTVCGHRRFERAVSCAYAAKPLSLGCLQPYTPGRILGWTPDAHSANVCLASCAYAAKHCPASCAYAAERIGLSIEENTLWDPPVFLKRPDGPTR